MGAVPACIPRTRGSLIPLTKAKGIPTGGPPPTVQVEFSAAARLEAVSAPDPHSWIVSLAAATQPDGAKSSNQRTPDPKTISATIA